MAQGARARAWGTQRQIFPGHDPWALSHEPWGMSHEPWAMSHEPLTSNNRWINELFDYSLYVLSIIQEFTRKFPSDNLYRGSHKRHFPNEGFQAQIPMRKCPTGVIQSKLQSPEPKLPSECSQVLSAANPPKRHISIENPGNRQEKCGLGSGEVWGGGGYFYCKFY